MKHLKVYFKIIRKAKLEKREKNSNLYYESHHIRPRCIGGSNKKTNLVLLTAREHFICHALLSKSFCKNKKYLHKMIKAFYMMKTINNFQESRYFNSRLFDYNKNRLYGPNSIVPNARIGSKHTKETKEKMSIASKGKEKSKEHKDSLSKNSARKGKKPWNYGIKTPKDVCEKLSKSHKGIKLSEEHKSKLKGRTAWNKGVAHSKETKEKMSNAKRKK